MLAENRASRMLPFHDRFERTVRCGRKFEANSVTFGAEFENTVPAVLSAQRSGMAAGLFAKSVQSGTGAAGPTHMSCCVPLASPVLSMADPTWPPALLVNTPTPPRTTARGPRNAPMKAAMSCDWPSVHENPTRGLNANGVGRRSLRRPNVDSTAGLNCGCSRYRVASTRTPYWICKSCVLRYESPSAIDAETWPVDRSRARNVRLNDAGRPSSRSSSELNEKVPSRFAEGSCLLALCRSSVVSLIRCLFALSNQESVFCSVLLVVRDDELRFWLPPNVRF